MNSILKYKVLTGFALGAAFFGLAYAGVTGFGSIKLVDSPGLIKDSGNTTRISLATSGTNVTITGAVQQSSTTFSGTAQPLAFAASFITLGTTVARSTGTLAFDSDWVAYIATGSTNGSQWVKIGGQ